MSEIVHPPLTTLRISRRDYARILFDAYGKPPGILANRGGANLPSWKTLMIEVR
jgi:hypothetical protein